MRHLKTVFVSAISLFLAGHAHADGTSAENPTAEEPGQTLKTITVTASKLPSLDQAGPTGSRLGLSVRETPGTIDSIDNDEMIGRGFHTAEQAIDTLPGVTSGGSPGDVSQFSMRGFTGNQIVTLHNGLNIGPANMTNREQNTFNLDRVEVLKGPASVLYGQGAVGGVVNFINKMPDFGEPSINSEMTYGSFNSTSMGVGASTHWGDTLAFRGDVSRTSTDGFVHGADADSLNATGSLLWRPDPTLDVRFTFDYLNDHPSDYFGTPLLPKSVATQPIHGVISSSTLAIDQRTRYLNYNVSDANIYSHQYWPQLLVKWSPNAIWTFQNLSYYFKAKRKWFDAETYTYDAATNKINRDRFFVTHDQSMVGDQGSATYEAPVLGFDNKVVTGFDYSHLDFKRGRGFPNNDEVDLFSPDRGLFGSDVTRVSPTYWDNTAVFMEDVLSITPSLKLVTGGRFDYLDLDRENYDASGNFIASTSFHRAYWSSNWRGGLVYDINAFLTSYASFTTGADPVGDSNIFLVNANQNFKLSSSRQYEIGLKGTIPNGRLDGTLALYDINRANILTQTAIDAVSNAGSQKSRGIELALNAKLTDNWRASANGSYTDASYGTFIDTSTGLNDSGHQPLNVPRWTANLWLSYDHVADVPWEIGGGLRYIGKRFANNANSLTLDDYILVDLYTSYQLKPGVMLVGRVNNLFDKIYAQWADQYYPTEIMLGAPRSFEISLVTKF